MTETTASALRIGDVTPFGVITDITTYVIPGPHGRFVEWTVSGLKEAAPERSTVFVAA